MNIKLFVRFHQRGIQITVFHSVTAATEKMTGSAVFTSGSPHTLSNFIPVRRIIGFFVTFEYHLFGCGIPGAGRKLFIGSGLFVADQAIDFTLVTKVEIFSLPSISGMA
jgi:hypothetical protein